MFSDGDSWAILLPLAGRCELGNAAKLMRCEHSVDAAREMAAVNAVDLPAPVFLHAMRLGCPFPLGPLYLEDAAALAETLAQDLALLKERALASAEALAEEPEDAALLWADALQVSAVKHLDWQEDKDAAEIARAFANVERLYLPFCYTEQVRMDLDLLPPEHRFGLFCARAFDAINEGDTAGFMRALREGLQANEAAKPVVERMMKEAQALTRRAAMENAPPELRRLAVQVRNLLAMYPADDPVVRQIKASPAYQKVSYLIEG